MGNTSFRFTSLRLYAYFNYWEVHKREKITKEFLPVLNNCFLELQFLFIPWPFQRNIPLYVGIKYENDERWNGSKIRGVISICMYILYKQLGMR